MDLRGQRSEFRSALDAEPDTVGQRLDGLAGGVDDLFRIGGVELGVGLALAVG